ncbi:MAG: hypothetical protein AAF682_06520 [Planctomycetota bacterium]
MAPPSSLQTLVLGRRRHDPWLLGAALVSPVALLVGATFVLRARIALGEWPQLYRPDPAELGFDLHHLAWILALNALWLSPLWTLAVLAVRRVLHGARYRQLPVAALSLVLWCACLALLVADPGSFVAWTLD